VSDLPTPWISSRACTPASSGRALRRMYVLQFSTRLFPSPYRAYISLTSRLRDARAMQRPLFRGCSRWPFRSQRREINRAPRSVSCRSLPISIRRLGTQRVCAARATTWLDFLISPGSAYTVTRLSRERARSRSKKRAVIVNILARARTRSRFLPGSCLFRRHFRPRCFRPRFMQRRPCVSRASATCMNLNHGSDIINTPISN
jgi:hypothetical protein